MNVGITALRLGAQAPSRPSISLTDWGHALILDRFIRAGGDDLPTTATEARILWDEQHLHVRFQCHNPYRFSQAEGHESALHREDCVELAIQTPDMPMKDFVRITVHSTDTSVGARISEAQGQRNISEAGEGVLRMETREIPLLGYHSEVLHEENDWSAMIALPWQVCGGGPPAGPFRFMLMRARHLTGEVISPSTLDSVANFSAKLTDPSTFMEAHLGGEAEALTTSEVLAALPSGILYWQLPARLIWPERAEREHIRQLQNQHLADHTVHTGTTAATLSERIHWAQRWTELLTLEGMDFHPGMQPSYPQKLVDPWTARRKVNEALRCQHIQSACEALDEYLHFLHERTRSWYADQTPGNIADEKWIPVGALCNIALDSDEAQFTFDTASGPFTVSLSLPDNGGLRLHGERVGYFHPVSSLPLSTVPTTDMNIAQFQSERLKLFVRHTPEWDITVQDASGTDVWHLEQGNARFLLDSDDRICAWDLSCGLAEDEQLYGFGERFDSLNQRGSIMTLWQRDCWHGNIAGIRNHAYKTLPFFHSSRGYSLFWNSSYRMRIDAGRDDPGRLRITAAGPVLDIYLWPAAPLEAIRGYTSLTGKPLLPPKWAFEPWAGGGGGRWRNGPLGNNVQEVINVMRRFKELDIPHAAVYAENVPPAAELYEAMNELNIRVMNWHLPVIEEAAASSLLPDMTALELPLLQYAEPDKLIGRKSYMDFSHPNAMHLLRAYWKERLDAGVAGSMIDFGDLVPEMALFHNGQTGDEMQNFYAYEYARHYMRLFCERRGQDFILFQRAAAPGTQAFAGQFGGDHPSNFIGLSASLSGGLSLASCGFPFWGSDMGGYRGKPDEEAYLRWLALSVFTPFMRVHGTDPREPWEYRPAAVAIYKKWAWIRENLLDYIYSCAINSHLTGEPMMKAMPLVYPHEPAVRHAAEQYMFGDDLLVAPIIGEGNAREIVFPSGHWTCLWTGETFAGPGSRVIEIALDQIAVYVRSGAAIPLRMHPSLQWGASMTDECKHVLLVTLPVQEENRIIWLDANRWTKVRLVPSADSYTVEVDGEVQFDQILYHGNRTSLAAEGNS